MWIKFSRLVVALVLVGGAVLAAQSNPRQLPPPFATPSADNRSQVVPKPAGANLPVPTGFVVDVVAEGFETPRFITSARTKIPAARAKRSS
jgi:hypothetical protein